MDRIFREDVHAYNLQDTAHALTGIERLIENGYHEVDGHCDPDLRLPAYAVIAAKAREALLAALGKRYESNSLFYR